MTTKIITIPHKIHFLVEVNIFVIVGRKTVLVDTGVRDSYRLILKAFEKYRIDKNSVSLILVTHSHPDHCLGITNLKKHFNAPVAISKAEAPYLRKGDFSPVTPTNLLGKIVFWFLRSLHEKHEDVVEPDIIFEKMLDLEAYGIEGKAVLTPGHSIGGCSVVLKDGTCILGDLLIEDVLTKKPRTNLFATDLHQLKKSLRTLITPETKTIYTSHGNAWQVEKIKANLNKLLK